MIITIFNRRLAACLLLCLPSAGCLTIMDATFPQAWQGDTDVNLDLIPEIVVGETTRAQIEAMFGKPKRMYAGNDYYVYMIIRTHTATFSFSGIKSETMTLLAVAFNSDDIVREVLGPQEGAAEVLEQLRRKSSTGS